MKFPRIFTAAAAALGRATAAPAHAMVPRPPHTDEEVDTFGQEREVIRAERFIFRGRWVSREMRDRMSIAEFEANNTPEEQERLLGRIFQDPE